MDESVCVESCNHVNDVRKRQHPHMARLQNLLQNGAKLWCRYSCQHQGPSPRPTLELAAWSTEHWQSNSTAPVSSNTDYWYPGEGEKLSTCSTKEQKQKSTLLPVTPPYMIMTLSHLWCRLKKLQKPQRSCLYSSGWRLT